jgi:hypothetical protein
MAEVITPVGHRGLRQKSSTCAPRHRRPRWPPKPIMCDCGQPATQQMNLKVRKKLVTFNLCDACVALELS